MMHTANKILENLAQAHYAPTTQAVSNKDITGCSIYVFQLSERQHIKTTNTVINLLVNMPHLVNTSNN